MKTKTPQAKIILTGVYMKDEKSGEFTGFFSQFPGAVSQGESLEEAEEKLFESLPMLMEVINEAKKEDAFIDGKIETTTRSYEFQSASM